MASEYENRAQRLKQRIKKAYKYIDEARVICEFNKKDLDEKLQNGKISAALSTKLRADYIRQFIQVKDKKTQEIDEDDKELDAIPFWKKHRLTSSFGFIILGLIFFNSLLDGISGIDDKMCNNTPICISKLIKDAYSKEPDLEDRSYCSLTGSN